MRITSTCVPCLLKRVAFEAEISDPSKVDAAIKAACKVFGEHYTGGEVSAKLATKVHKAAYDAIGVKDPYKKVKDQSNEIAHGLLQKVKEVVAAADDRLEAAIKCAIIGNIMDFGIGLKYDEPEDLARHFDTLYKEPLGHNDLPRFRDLLKPGTRVVLFTDNCGEVIFDGVLCEVLRDMEVKVSMVVKGEPILTDATREDAERYGIDRLVDEFLDTGTYAVGVDMERLPKEVRKRLKEAVLVISKGMANYESFSDEDVHPIVHLMRTKCGPVAESMGLPLDKSVIAFYP
jgi:uncharacterized protein with ATP-grasp and redox domains